MDAQVLASFHRKLVDKGLANTEFDDADQVLLSYLIKVLAELKDLQEIKTSLRQQIEYFDNKVAQLRSHRKILRRALITAGLPDPFDGEDESGEFNAAEQTRVSARLETTELDDEQPSG